MNQLILHENGLYLVFELDPACPVRLMHFSCLPYDPALIREEEKESFRLTEAAVSGYDRPKERFGTNFTETSFGTRLLYVSHHEEQNTLGKKLVFLSRDPETGLEAESHLQFFDGIPVVRSRTLLRNTGNAPLGLEYVSSFALTGIDKEGLTSPDEKLTLLLAHNGWMKELCFSTHTMADFGMQQSQTWPMPRRSSQSIQIGNVGAWSAKRYLPLAALHNQETGSTLFWQIEHNGSWYWEIAEQKNHMYLQLSGPNEIHSHWWKNLRPGETFESVPVAVGSVFAEAQAAEGCGVAFGGLDEMAAALTRYRRKIRRENEDNQKLPIIFNDYMNCLFADPTTEKELPMVEKAAEAGCEYYVIDAGWYSDGYWWDGVGEWLPSRKRFPEGLPFLLEKIRQKGLIPGLWLEIEVMGIHSPLAAQTEDDWFFQRHGKRTYDRSRYQLDFRNPKVRAHADAVIDRLVREYGVGYIKMDYNMEPGIGTDREADSCGDGLLEHNRAYLAWLEDVFERYPDLVIENCSSGGMRMDYGMLSRHSIQSTSDLEDYLMTAVVAANAPLALTPEQAAVWSYPKVTGNREETIFNMVNALLLRIHQSGHLVHLKGERLDLVKEALSLYRSFRTNIPEAVPFWPLGLAGYSDDICCLGLRTDAQDIIAVWNRTTAPVTVTLPIHHRRHKEMTASTAFPSKDPCPGRWNRESGILTVRLPAGPAARVFTLQ